MRPRRLFLRAPLPVATAALSLFAGAPATWRLRLRFLPEMWRLVAAGAIVGALLSPSCTQHVTAMSSLDVLFLIDVSPSMEGMDLQPNRLARAQAVIQASMARRPDDRMGLLLFASDYTLACPLTTDRTAALSQLRQLHPADGAGTALGHAALGAIDLLRRVPGNDDVLVVVTDGASTREDVAIDVVRRRALDAAIPIVVLQTGAGGPVPMPTEFGVVVVDTEDTRERLSALSGGRLIDAARPQAGDELAEQLARIGARRPGRARGRLALTRLWSAAGVAALALHCLSAGALRRQP